jgi:uncharacterized membrane protein YbhN (UPF0104 family)
MSDSAGDLAALIEGLASDLAEALRGAAPGWLALGVALHLLNQVARGRGWYAVVRAAAGPDPALRRRDAVAAWVAGAGAGGVASARGGDVVRVLLLRRHVARADCTLLAGTLLAEGAGEIATGALLLALAAALGVAPALGAPTPWLLAVLPLAAAVLLLAHRYRLLRRVAAGCAALGSPRAYARDVLPWQCASRACRVASLACFLAAFSLPATLTAVLLVMFAQGSGRMLPFAPASVGAGVAVLAATFGPATGSAVPAGQLAACFVAMSALLTLAGIVLTTAICLREVRVRGLLDAVAAVRRRPAPQPQVP